VHKSKDKTVPVHATKAYRENGSVASPTLNLSTKWKYEVSLMPWLFHFTPEYVHPGTHGTGGWVIIRVSLDILEKRKISCPH